MHNCYWETYLTYDIKQKGFKKCEKFLRRFKFKVNFEGIKMRKVLQQLKHNIDNIEPIATKFSRKQYEG